MASAARHYEVAQRLLKSLGSTRMLPLSSVRVLETPQDFHSYLCQSVQNAKDRVCLASLYLGTGSKPEEAQLLQSLSQLNKSKVAIRILMDANRGKRPVQLEKPTEMTSSAQAAYEAVKDKIHLYQTLKQPLRSLPTPLNEAIGVFHLKSYITDDSLILSGANLSQEYFTDRQDRYMTFENERELVDFYRSLIEILSQNAHNYPSEEIQQSPQPDTMLDALANLFHPSEATAASIEDESTVVAYAFPTFGHPGLSLPFPSDTQQLTTLLTATAQEGLSVRLASAYLNPTQSFLKLLEKQLPDCTLLTAGPQSHGFAPKPGVKRTGDFVPKFFAHRSQQLSQQFNLLFYNRPGWTFHAKGLWVLSKEGNLVAAVVGSGNYGYRSEQRDVESNLILVFPKETSPIQQELLQEWQRLCEYAEEPVFSEPVQHHVRAFWPLIQSYF
jgi:CDP-diacylglycerol---glycerol-3-phosphate 3-phosphatidyltransferase